MSKRPHIKTKKKDIIEYWCDKAVTADGNIVPDIEEYFKCSVPMIYDCGESRCFACNKEISTLERAHIVPLALGGQDTPKNYVLLCKECHKESPDCIEEEAMFQYIYQKRTNEDYNLRILRLINNVLNEKGIDPSKGDMDTQLLSSFETKINSHGAIISDGTFKYILMQCIREKG